MYQILFSTQARKAIRKLPNETRSLIKESIEVLANNPRPRLCKKLSGREAYRIRVRDYRIIYRIIDTELIIDIVKIGHRKNIYK